MSYFLMPALLRLRRAFGEGLFYAWAFMLIALDVSLVCVLVYAVSAK
jgi:hypothetical protein